MSLFADPIISANLYAGGLLDSAISGFAAPVARALRGFSGEPGWLWVMRYLRRGEHLKVRIHCSASQESEIRALVFDAAHSFLQKAEEVGPRNTAKSGNRKIPAIDLEDEIAQPADDRSFVWTHYRRTHVAYAGAPWLSDISYVERASRCLSAGFGLALRLWTNTSAPAIGLRQVVIAKAAVNALAALELKDRDSCRSYLTYHRDWLLRYFILETEKEQQTLRLFAQRVDVATETIRSLAAIFEERWHAAGARVASDDWTAAIESLSCYVRGLTFGNAYDIDPFAPLPWFPPVFKVLHALSNQIGLPPMQEAYLYHLLLAALEAMGRAPEACSVRAEGIAC